MRDDPIVEEVRRIRREYLAEFGGDIHKMLDDVRRRQAEHREGVVSFPSTPAMPKAALQKKRSA